jgi:RNA polymerase sigma factor (sigma-70 family)
MAGRAKPTRSDRATEQARELADWLAREQWDYLAAVAIRNGVDRDSVADVVQSALGRFLAAFPGPPRRDKVRAYAAVVVQREAWRLARRRGRKEGRERPLPERERSDSTGTVEPSEVLGDPRAPDPAERVIERELAGEAWDLLRTLPPDERAVKLLSAAGYSAQEIAERLGLGLRGVRKRVQRANWRLSPCPVCKARAGVEAGLCRSCGAVRNSPT